jgi:hypothetical protein
MSSSIVDEDTDADEGEVDDEHRGGSQNQRRRRRGGDDDDDDDDDGDGGHSALDNRLSTCIY